MQKIISRLTPEIVPDTPLPFHVRSTGYNEAEPGWFEHTDGKNKNFIQLFWTLNGTGCFYLNKQKFQTGPGDIFYHLPFDEHYHLSANPKETWKYYWITFDGKKAKDFFMSYHWKQKVYYAGDCPANLFQETQNLLLNRTPYAEHHALSIALEIIALARTSKKTNSGNTTRNFIKYIEKHYSESDLSINKIARLLNIHRTTLFRIFQSEMKISPKLYLNRYRIQKALALLLETDFRIKEIAAKSGFSHVSHFCEIIRKTTGSSPEIYRQKLPSDYA